MGITQRASAAFTGASFTPTLSAASSASNLLVVLVLGNTTVTTPTGWTLKTSSVVSAGLYWFEKQGDGATSWTFTCVSGGGTWNVFEIASGTTGAAAGGQANVASATYTSTTTTPTAGTRELLVGFEGQATVSTSATTVTAMTGGFTELSGTDLQATTGTTDWPQGVVGSIDDAATDGVTAYSSTATYSQNRGTKGALIGWVATTASSGPALATPTNVVATAVSSTQINVSWDPVPGATAYEIERNGLLLGFTVSGSPYNDTSRTASTTTTYRIRAVK
jgi:hypothetical protein